MKLQSKKDIRLLTVLGCLVYFSSYITRINFAAVLVEFLQAENVLKSSAAFITTALFITYGAGQLISGYLGDRLNPRLLIFTGLLVAVSANILLPLVSPSIGLMTAVWGINGLAQAFMWPPLVKILTAATSMEDYAKIAPTIGSSGACGTIAVYLLCPLLIFLSGWKSVFIVTATIAAITAFVWLFVSKKLLKEIAFTAAAKETVKSEESLALPKVLMLILPVILLSIAMQGMLRDGISTWLPTFLTESFRLESVVSILVGVALPIMHVLVNLIAYKLLLAMKRDVFAAIGLLFTLICLLLLSMHLFAGSSVIVSMLLIALANGAINGVNTLQTCYIPALFGASKNLSFIAGLLNAGTYIGSAVSIYLFAVISERFGWGATVIGWVITAAAGIGLTILCREVLRRRKQHIIK